MDSQTKTEEVDDGFLFHINATDPLQILVRGHLHVESRLNELISLRLSEPNQLDLSELSFPRRLDLAAALGCISASDKPPYLILNSLRNKLAHNLNYQVTTKDLHNLVNSMPSLIRNIHKKNLKRIPPVKEDFMEHFRWCIALLLTYLERLSEILRANQSLNLTAKAEVIPRNAQEDGK